MARSSLVYVTEMQTSFAIIGVPFEIGMSVVVGGLGREARAAARVHPDFTFVKQTERAGDLAECVALVGDGVGRTSSDPCGGCGCVNDLLADRAEEDALGASRTREGTRIDL